jgi:hypothetical protein
MSEPTRKGRLALTPTEAAQALGRSGDFFDKHIGPELRWVRRGRLKLRRDRRARRLVAPECGVHARARLSAGSRDRDSMESRCKRDGRTSCVPQQRDADVVDPSLPWNVARNRLQPTATVLACFRGSGGLAICDQLPPVATTGLHKGSILCCPRCLHLALDDVLGRQLRDLLEVERPKLGDPPRVAVILDRREQRDAEGVEGASEASRRRDQPERDEAARDGAEEHAGARSGFRDRGRARSLQGEMLCGDDRERGRRKRWYVRVVWLTFHSILEGTPPASSANEAYVEGLGLQSSRQRCEHDDVVLGSASGLYPAQIDNLLIRPSEVLDEDRSFSLRLAAVPR